MADQKNEESNQTKLMGIQRLCSILTFIPVHVNSYQNPWNRWDGRLTVCWGLSSNFAKESPGGPSGELDACASVSLLLRCRALARASRAGAVPGPGSLCVLASVPA